MVPLSARSARHKLASPSVGVKLSHLPTKMAIAKAATFGMALRRCSASKCVHTVDMTSVLPRKSAMSRCRSEDICNTGNQLTTGLFLDLTPQRGGHPGMLQRSYGKLAFEKPDLNT